MNKYWFYFGMGIKEGQIVHKNGIVGSDTEFCPIIDIENSVMLENNVEDFHVVNFQEVPEAMFLEFKRGLKERMSSEVSEEEFEEIKD